MGFDIFAVKATSKKGEYFRNSVWWWRPLWTFVSKACKDILTNQDIKEGEFNNGHQIDADKAQRIAQRLFELIEKGDVQKFSRFHKQRLEELPDEVCEDCQGTGKQKGHNGYRQCNVCSGKGKKRPWETYYPFDTENIREFAEFCRDCGGFIIS